MYQYSYVRVEMETNGYSLFGGVGIGLESHRAIIDARAADGWRYVGFLPVKQRAEGFISAVDLIFEKEVE